MKKTITIIRKGADLAYDGDEKGLSVTNGCPKTVHSLMIFGGAIRAKNPYTLIISGKREAAADLSMTSFS